MFMIMFMIVAIINAKKKSAWIWFGIGTGLQLLSLSGNQKIANANGRDTAVDWMVFLGILILSVSMILIRYYKANREDT